MLKRVNEIIPERYNFCHLAYSQHYTLQFGGFTISSQQEPQQGDPLGGLLFCLAIQPILSSLSSAQTVSFMDDITLGGHRGTVSSDVRLFRIEEAKLGLNLSVSKCEVISRDQRPFEGPIVGFTRINPSDAVLLVAP